MRYFSIILLLILFGCLSETKPEMETEIGIDKSVYDLWENFSKSHPEFKKEELPDSSHFTNNKEDANRLAELTLTGKKKASSSLYTWFEEADADLPKIGTKHIITDFDGKARAIIEIIKVDTIPFNKISEEYAALDMATTIDALEKWKKAHWNFFERVMEKNDQKPTEDMLIVCERFENIWPEND